jgi:aspartate 1-decarboxylase
MRIILKSKIHRAIVTDTDLNYIASIFIDEALLEKVNIAKHERVDVLNITNGKRWQTYVMPLKRNSGIISVNGAGARLCQKGDKLIILAYEITEKKIEPKIIIVTPQNKFIKYL